MIIGIDHGTTKITFAFLTNDLKLKTYSRFKPLKPFQSIVMENGFVLDDIDAVVFPYSMGDAISEIVGIKDAENRGVKGKSGVKIGSGTRLFDELKELSLPVFLLPGIHRNIECLDERFKVAYSHIASGEKLASCYYVFRQFGEKSFLLSDISSNTVSVAVVDGEVKGGIDATLGAMGLIQGPIDLEGIRRIENGEDPHAVFSSCGIVKFWGKGVAYEEIGEKLVESMRHDKRAKLAFDTLIMTVKMEIFSLLSVFDVNTLYITGSFGVMDEVYGKIKEELQIDVKRITEHSGAIGSAYIGKDMLDGKKSFMGVKVRTR